MATGDQDYTSKCHCCCQMPDKGHVTRLEAELSRLKERNKKLEAVAKLAEQATMLLACGGPKMRPCTSCDIKEALAALDGNGEGR